MHSLLRGLVFSFVLGLYRAWDEHDPLADPLGSHIRHLPAHPLEQPARTFFWGVSSMAN